MTLAPVATTIVDAPMFRLTVEPSGRNGLRSVSQIMIDKVTAVRRERLGQAIGSLEDDAMLRVSRALLVWFGLVS